MSSMRSMTMTNELVAGFPIVCQTTPIAAVCHAPNHKFHRFCGGNLENGILKILGLTRVR